jgi:hypothetical protein
VFIQKIEQRIFSGRGKRVTEGITSKNHCIHRVVQNQAQTGMRQVNEVMKRKKQRKSRNEKNPGQSINVFT